MDLNKVREKLVGKKVYFTTGGEVNVVGITEPPKDDKHTKRCIYVAEDRRGGKAYIFPTTEIFIKIGQGGLSDL